MQLGDVIGNITAKVYKSSANLGQKICGSAQTDTEKECRESWWKTDPG